MEPVTEPRERFEQIVVAALDELPEWIRERLDNVDVLIEEEPPPDQPALLGLYQGIPLTQRGFHYAGVLPDRITLFRGPIERAVRSEAELQGLIRHTVVHEFAHFFGISDDRLREIGRY
jgi:predicted Zn-dependent protease with MMP-like domain